MTEKEIRNIVSDWPADKFLEVNDEKYTVGDQDTYTSYIFTGLTANRVFTLPSLKKHPGKKIVIYNLSGTYKVIVTPFSTDLLNDWNTTFEITEKGGRLECLALSTHWECTPNENCCIYKVSSETPDAGLALDGTYDDVNGMALPFTSSNY